MSVSVIVATYGDRKWADLAMTRAIPSTENQGLCPPDAPVHYAGLVYHDSDGTVASARNDGARVFGADWLCFLDADDELAPGYIRAMETAVERQPNATRLLFTPAVQTIRPGRAPGPPAFFREVPLRQANWLVVGTLIHRDLFWEVGGFPEAEHGLEDWALWSKCARVGATVVKVPDAVYRYWANPNSMHRQLWRDKKVQRAAHARVAAELDEWEKAHV